MWKMIVGDGESQYGPDYTWIDFESRSHMNKLASAGIHVPENLSKAIDELKDTLPHNKVAFYNRALGAYESFGLNRNGDGFERHWLEKKHDTFVKNAHYFMHHQNKDPSLSRGRPVASALNEKTNMVDLIIVADMDKCAEQIHALESGKRVPTSMGAKVAYDVCTICGHQAKTRANYCEHVHKLASAPYGMRQVLPDGRVCGVMNPNPNFFDLSDVVIGAAPESETLLKVASYSGVISGAELADLAGLEKLSRNVEATIVKRVPGVIEGSPIFRRGMGQLSRRETRIPNEVIDSIRDESGFEGVLKNAAALGIVLKPGEFARAGKLGSFTPPTFDEIWASESMPQKVLSASLSKTAIAKLAKYYPHRSSHMPVLFNRIDNLMNKVASADSSGDDEKARMMYAAYRRSLLDDMGTAGGKEGEYWSMKCAGTSSRMYTERSKDYVSSAFLPMDNVHKNTDLMNKVSCHKHQFTSITGNLADEIGVVALDEFALQSFS